MSMILREDDLEVGQYVCVYNIKEHPDGSAPIMGQSLHIKAINLPYIVAQLLSDPQQPTLTFDCRFLNLMKVTDEFVKAQQEGAKLMPMQGMMRHKRRSRKEE